MKNLLLPLLAVSLFLAACEDEGPDIAESPEPIRFLVPDSTAVQARGGDVVDVSILLTSDSIIDTLRAGYLIDTVNITTNLALSDMDTIFLTTGFDPEDNQQTYTGTLTLPDSIPGVRGFFVGDKVRVVFAMEAGGMTREKQLRIDMRP